MFKNAIISKVRQSYNIINARAVADDKYRQLVLDNPREAIRIASGFNIPCDWDISICDTGERLRILIRDDRWLRRFGLSKRELQKSLNDIIM